MFGADLVWEALEREFIDDSVNCVNSFAAQTNFRKILEVQDISQCLLRTTALLRHIQKQGRHSGQSATLASTTFGSVSRTSEAFSQIRLSLASLMVSKCDHLASSSDEDDVENAACLGLLIRATLEMEFSYTVLQNAYFFLEFHMLFDGFVGTPWGRILQISGVSYGVRWIFRTLLCRILLCFYDWEMILHGFSYTLRANSHLSRISKCFHMDLSYTVLQNAPLSMIGK